MSDDTSVTNAYLSLHIKEVLSTLWMFAVLNYIYAHVFPAVFGGMAVPGFTALMETSIFMVPPARFLAHMANRADNNIADVIHTVSVVTSTFVATPAPACAFSRPAQCS